MRTSTTFYTTASLVALSLTAVAFTTTGCNGKSEQFPPTAASAAIAASYQAEEGSFAFEDFDAISALAFGPHDPNTLYALQQGGKLRVLDLTQAQVTNPRDIVLANLSPSGFPTAAAGLVIDSTAHGNTTAGFATSTGAGANSLYLFDAVSGTTPTTTFDFGALELSAMGLQTSTGTADPVFHPTDSSSAALAVAGDLLLVGCSSLMPQSYLDNYPGVVLAFQLDTTDHTRLDSSVAQPVAKVFTRGFNVTGISTATTVGGHPVAYITTTGAGRSFFGIANRSPANATHARIEVLDLQTLAICAEIPLGPSAARGAVAVNSTGTEGVIGRGDFDFGLSEIYRVSLLDIDQTLATATVDDLSQAIVNGIANPIIIAFANPALAPTGRYVSALRYAPEGQTLYAIAFNDSTFNVFDMRSSAPTLTYQHRLSRGLETANTFGPNAATLAIRPGTAGVDYVGPDIFVGTIGIVTDPATYTTRSELDAFTSP